MALEIVPLQAIPAQVFQIALGGQDCRIAVYQKLSYDPSNYAAPAIYVDIGAGLSPIVIGMIAHNRRRLVRSAYLGFIGDLFFFDTQGDMNPVYTGLGTRFLLYYDATL